MDNITKTIVNVRRENLELEWRDVTAIVNYTCGTDMTHDAVRKRYQKYVKKHGESRNVSFEKMKDYRDFVSLHLTGNSLIISDTHAPFTVDGAIRFLQAVQREYNIKNVFHIGDFADQYALSFFDKVPESDSIDSEHKKAKAFTQELAAAFPKMYGVLGNHDNRFMRVAAKAGLPLQFIRTFEEILDMPDGWQWERSYMLNNNILIEHGSASGMRATYDRALITSKNVVQGHTHSYGGVVYVNDGITQRWALNVGCLADQATYAMKYAVDRKYQHTLGCGVLLNNNSTPLFIPYERV